MIKYMALMLASVLYAASCGGYQDFEPATPLTAEQWESVNKVEARVPAAIITFGRAAFKVRPRITVVSSPDQFIPQFQLAWKDLPDKFGVKERVEGEGYSGLWRVPNIYISVIGDRASQFLSLYAHERAHTFFGGGHPPELVDIEKFLRGE